MHRICAFMLVSLSMLSMGCSYNSFGVDQKEWERLTPEQQNMVIEGYYQRKQKEAEMAPLRDAIDAIQKSIRSKNDSSQ